MHVFCRNGYLDDDKLNCGACGTVCGRAELCVDGACVPELICGDDVCYPEEIGTCPLDCGTCGDGTCQSHEVACCKDCGCDSEYVCEENVCIMENKCEFNGECKDDNPCTKDVCEGSPKECLYLTQKGCAVGDNCLPVREQFVDGDTPSFCRDDGVVEAQREEGVSCEFSYECLNNDCRDGLCYVERPTFFQRFFSWLRSLAQS